MFGPQGDAPRTDSDLRSVVADGGALAYQARFVDAVDDDLDLPLALTVLHQLVSDDAVSPEDRRTLVASWDAVLGLDLVRADALPAELDRLVREREDARARKDFARADEIRDRLRDSGVELLDGPTGTRWVRR
jgi:cysteinyl-tRNA synthetase